MQANIFKEIKQDNEIDLQIDYSTFSSRQNIVDAPILILPDYITSINSINTLEDGPFANLRVEQIILPKGLKKLGYQAITSCPNLKSLNIPSTVTSIGIRTGAAFYQLPALTQLAYEGTTAE